MRFLRVRAASTAGLTPSWSRAWPVLAGVAAFFCVVGPRPLNPANIGWLALDDDPLTHYLGWAVFRNGPITFPLGLNGNYGLELGNAILFSDSIPLLAIPFKFVSTWLPEPFQYFGGWILACFVLQAWFGWKLAGLISSSNRVRLLACGLFVFAPPMLWRLQLHLALVAHFVVLAALYLHFRPRDARTPLWWCVLTSITTAIHAYLLAMVLALWIANLLTRLVRTPDRRGIVRLLAEAGAVFGGFLVVAWQVGYFSAGRSVWGAGYGLYRMNALSLIDSSGWSRVLGSFPGGIGDYEGFNYPGLGVIALALFALPTLARRRGDFAVFLLRRHSILLAVLLLLTLFALTNHVGVGGHELSFTIPYRLEMAAGLLRASGRMFWPVFYALLFGVVACIVDGASPSRATALLAIGLLIQIVDTSAGWRPITDRFIESASDPLKPALTDRFWTDAAAMHRKVRRVHPGNHLDQWSIFASYAAAQHLATDSVYLARIDQERLAALSRRYDAMKPGVFDADSLYVIDDDKRLKTLLQLDPDSDMFARVDGYNVLAPGWKRCRSCSQPAADIRMAALARPIAIDKRVVFATGHGGDAYLIDGWSRSEAAGTWSMSDSGTVVLPVEGPLPTSLRLEAAAYVSDRHPSQAVEIDLDDGPATRVTLTRASSNVVDVPVEPARARMIDGQRYLVMHLRFKDAVRPVDLGDGGRRDALAIRLVAITFR